MKFFSEIRTVATTLIKFKRKVEKFNLHVYKCAGIQASFIQATSTNWRTGKDVK